MFEQLKGELFTCGLDNIYISANICRAALTEITQMVMTYIFVELVGADCQNASLCKRKQQTHEKGQHGGKSKLQFERKTIW